MLHLFYLERLQAGILTGNGTLSSKQVGKDKSLPLYWLNAQKRLQFLMELSQILKPLFFLNEIGFLDGLVCMYSVSCIFVWSWIFSNKFFGRILNVHLKCNHNNFCFPWITLSISSCIYIKKIQTKNQEKELSAFFTELWRHGHSPFPPNECCAPCSSVASFNMRDLCAIILWLGNILESGRYRFVPHWSQGGPRSLEPASWESVLITRIIGQRVGASLHILVSVSHLRVIKGDGFCTKLCAVGESWAPLFYMLFILKWWRCLMCCPESGH